MQMVQLHLLGICKEVDPICLECRVLHLPGCDQINKPHLHLSIMQKPVRGAHDDQFGAAQFGPLLIATGKAKLGAGCSPLCELCLSMLDGTKIVTLVTLVQAAGSQMQGLVLGLQAHACH